MKLRRKALIHDIEMLPERINMTLTDEYIVIYKQIAEVLKHQQNLFCLGKGTGYLATSYMAQKFMQIGGIHAAAYPSGEFRHGPLSMIDDECKTPVVFVMLQDEHLSQILSNILQVKERGATTIVLSGLEDIETVIDPIKIDYLIKLDPCQSILAALQAIPPLQLICYYTALARGINPDQQIFDAIDFNESDV